MTKADRQTDLGRCRGLGRRSITSLLAGNYTHKHTDLYIDMDIGNGCEGLIVDDLWKGKQRGSISISLRVTRTRLDMIVWEKGLVRE